MPDWTNMAPEEEAETIRILQEDDDDEWLEICNAENEDSEE